jgi:hypothetical protein
MNIYAGLLFLQGHIADAGLARRLAEPAEGAEVDAVPSGPADQQHRSVGRPAGSNAVALSPGAGPGCGGECGG